MAWSIQIKGSAAKALGTLPPADRRCLVAAIDRLATEPHAGSILKGEFAGLRRIRVGVYRIVYEARDQELIILVVRVAQRKEAYG